MKQLICLLTFGFITFSVHAAETVTTTELHTVMPSGDVTEVTPMPENCGDPIQKADDLKARLDVALANMNKKVPINDFGGALAQVIKENDKRETPQSTLPAMNTFLKSKNIEADAEANALSSVLLEFGTLIRTDCYSIAKNNIETVAHNEIAELEKELFEAQKLPLEVAKSKSASLIKKWLDEMKSEMQKVPLEASRKRIINKKLIQVQFDLLPMGWKFTANQEFLGKLSDDIEALDKSWKEGKGKTPSYPNMDAFFKTLN